MSNDDMKDIAKFYSRALIRKDDPKLIKNDIKEFKSNFQTVKYCFQSDLAYPGL